MAIKDLTGQTFFRLKVRERLENNERKEICWLCDCECGNTVPATGIRLRAGITKSCGCYKSELLSEQKIKYHNLKPGQACINRLLRVYKDNSKKRSYEFNLTDAEFENLVLSHCHYCGTEPCLEVKIKGKKMGLLANGIDRINNSKGYDLENCVTCCSTCNYAKRDMTEKEFGKWITKVYNNLNK